MLIRPAARRGFVLCTILSALSFVSPSANAAETAQTVVKKMLAQYAGATSFQGTLKINFSGTKDKKPYTALLRQQMKYKSPNLVYIQVTQTGTGAAANTGQTAQTTVCDGKSLVRYRPTLKQYIKQPAPKLIKTLDFLYELQITIDPGTAKMLTPTTVQGHAVYVISGYPPLPPNLSAADRQKAYATFKPREYRIDKQNFQLLQIVQNDSKGNAVMMDLLPQTMNSAIADNAFVFTPPAGTTEVAQFGRPAAASAPSGGPSITPPGGTKLPKK